MGISIIILTQRAMFNYFFRANRKIEELNFFFFFFTAAEKVIYKTITKLFLFVIRKIFEVIFYFFLPFFLYCLYCRLSYE